MNQAATTAAPLAPDALERIDAWWRACNYLAVGMIYLQDNPLLRQPLKAEHVKSRLLGHWGASPGLSFMYAHLNRLISEHGQQAIFLAGPGHGAPGVLAPVYLEGTYSEIYPDKSEDDDSRLRQFALCCPALSQDRYRALDQSPRMRPDPKLRPWRKLSFQEQLRLREEYGHYLDQLPPTCSLETKIERFRSWLAERGVLYET